ncbi:hypothetical protein [Leifsonia sp. 1010]|uniref:hypothetical protein n=1 Tax=Leifsonia sp. 1010 TaxID=2817769 RepID=UPI002861931F|nr:hypothetical protein [Leifsonia sp. 1010]MDR6613591.1 hypothetical protein [Leifsonia sp. 1010]
MGAQLVGRAIAFAAMHDLKPNEYRLLIFMAYTALDSDQPPRYFASREMSAYALGRMLAEGVDLSDAQLKERASAFELVKVATRGLVNLGAIERLERGRAGRRAVYGVTFRGKSSFPLEGKDSFPLDGKPLFPSGASAPFPQGTTEEPEKDLGRRTPRFTEPSHLRPVDNTEERRSA